MEDEKCLKTKGLDFSGFTMLVILVFVGLYQLKLQCLFVFSALFFSEDSHFG